MIAEMFVKPVAVVATCLAVAGCASTSNGATPTGPSSAQSPSTEMAQVTAEPTSSSPAVSSTTSSTSSMSTTLSEVTTASVEPPASIFDVAIEGGEFLDEARDRRIPYRTYAPVGVTGEVPVVLVSHGGLGSEQAFRSGQHLGTTFAANGFIAIHIGHLPSKPGVHRLDRPADVSAVLDQLDADTLDLPDAFLATASADTTRVGHTGHSYGAYTAQAVGGATFDRTFTDTRIDAIAPISPQGAGQFRGFDNGPDDNTWMTVTIPAYNLIGGVEADSNAIGTIHEPGWRLVPFDNYPELGDKYVTVINGQDHSEMWSEGTAAVDAFVAAEIVTFFEVYVAGDPEGDPCVIGTAPLEVGYEFDRRADPAGLLTDCAL